MNQPVTLTETIPFFAGMALLMVAAFVAYHFLNKKVERDLAKRQAEREAEYKAKDDLAAAYLDNIRRMIGDKEYERCCRIGEEVCREAGLAVGRKDCPDAYKRVLWIGEAALKAVERDRRPS